MQSPADLRGKAARYRLLSMRATDQRLIEALNSLADEYDALAERLERENAENVERSQRDRSDET